MKQFTLIALLALAQCRAQEQHPITHREIAPVMGVGGADWLTRPEREAEEHPDAALDAIGIQRGSTIADIGAGVGFYTLRLSKRVGPEGKVYANDIQTGMLDLLKRNVAERGANNVVAVLGSDTDPHLPPNCADLILMVDVYHEFSHPQEMLAKLRESLKVDGRLVLLEFRGEDADLPIRSEHKMTTKQVVAEIEPAGFQLAKRIETLPRQHVFIFRKNESGR